MREAAGTLHPDTSHALVDAPQGDRAAQPPRLVELRRLPLLRACLDVPAVRRRARPAPRARRLSPATTAATASACRSAARSAARCRSRATARAPSAWSTSSRRSATRSSASTPTSRDAGALLRRFEAAPRGILVGTQMVAKGHDFPDVTLGVVVDADSTLRFPDFRAEERTFALVAQLAGRAGRGPGGGRVLVQTLAPERAVDRRRRAPRRRRLPRRRARAPRGAALSAVLAPDPDRLLGARAAAARARRARRARELATSPARRCSARRRCSACAAASARSSWSRRGERARGGAGGRRGGRRRAGDRSAARRRLQRRRRPAVAARSRLPAWRDRRGAARGGRRARPSARRRRRSTPRSPRAATRRSRTSASSATRCSRRRRARSSASTRSCATRSRAWARSCTTRWASAWPRRRSASRTALLVYRVEPDSPIVALVNPDIEWSSRDEETARRAA